MTQLAQPLADNLPLLEDEEHDFFWQLKDWYWRDGRWYLMSAGAHGLAFVVLALVAVNVSRRMNDAPELEAVQAEPPPDAKLQVFDRGEAILDPSELNTETLTMFEYKPVAAQDAKYYDDSAVFEEAGGGQKMDVKGPNLGGMGGFTDVKNVPGPALHGAGVGAGVGTGTSFGSGGSGSGFGGRGKGHREAMAGVYGGTKATERAVAAAINWLARHQMAGGNWSLNHTSACQNGHCSGPGSVNADAAATGMALLPFLAAGQTHKSKGPYREQISKGVYWLTTHQKTDGDLSSGAFQPMYSHGIATIALCECYGMTGDDQVRNAAQRAVKFIENAQNKGTGGWRYMPGDEGDTSVTGWQMMALKSAQMARLEVNHEALDNVGKWLKSVAKGTNNGKFSYLPTQDFMPTTTAIGTLCSQYLGVARDDPAMVEGIKYLLDNMPDAERDRNAYYWYYATMVMHNYLGPEWDRWNRQMRRVLILSQAREGCANGSWDPDRPSSDAWGSHGGRLMLTAFGALTLEVYYRYLPLFRIDPAGEAFTNAAKEQTEKDKDKADKPAGDQKPDAPKEEKKDDK
jgi:hypothetical protein